ncbi:hypothetical protein AX16_009903 [Volvariella volvacea WC 439]|nr:hypothetical protein AX16_009903 [Volvariella volvacea WC 439]
MNSDNFRRLLGTQRPPQFIFDIESTDSDATRQPKFYDTHLHEGLLLKHVRVVPQLPEFFIRCAVGAIDKTSESKRRVLLKKIIGICKRDMAWNTATIPIADEMDLQSQFKTRFAQLSQQVASRLLFGDDRDYFNVTKPPPAALRVTGSKAQLDLYSRIAGIDDTTPDLELVKDMLQARRSSLMAWELKSLAAGDYSTMESVVAQEGSFEWTYCTKKSENCEKRHHWNRFRPGVSGAPCGPDAQLPVELVESRSTFTQKEEYGVPDTHLTEIEAGTHIERAARKQFPRQKGKWICQQVWAGAVASDVTLVIVRSGTWEIYCIRIRSTQTLLISPVIDVQAQADYLLLQSGLTIFAYQDAIERAKALKRGVDPFRELKYDFPQKKGKESKSEQELRCPEDVYKELMQHFPKGLINIQLWTADFPAFDCPFKDAKMNFRREPEYTESGSVNFLGSPEAILRLHAESPSGDLREVCEGVLYARGLQVRVIIKLRDAKSGSREVRQEYRKYCKLSSVPEIKKGLAWSLGLYKHEVDEDACTQSSSGSMADSYHCMWVMIWGGDDLTHYTTISQKARGRFEELMKCLHDNGWAHRRVTRKHLLWDKETQRIHKGGSPQAKGLLETQEANSEGAKEATCRKMQFNLKVMMSI